MGVVFVELAFLVAFAVAVWDLARIPDWAWRRAAVSKPRWRAVVVSSFLVGLGGVGATL